MIKTCSYLSVLFLILLIQLNDGQVVFESLCSSDVEVTGISAVDGNDEFEIDLYEPKFLPDDTILCKKQNFIFFYSIKKNPESFSFS